MWFSFLTSFISNSNTTALLPHHNHQLSQPITRNIFLFQHSHLEHRICPLPLPVPLLPAIMSRSLLVTTIAFNSSIISNVRNLRLCGCPPLVHRVRTVQLLPEEFRPAYIRWKRFPSDLKLLFSNRRVVGWWMMSVVVAGSCSETLRDQKNLQTVGELGSVMGDFEYYSAQTKCL